MFLLDDSHLAAFYTLPFVLALALPGWRSILIAGGAAFALTMLATATAGGGIGSVLGLIYVWTLFGGLCSGLLARALTLKIAPLSEHPYRFLMVVAVGYVLSPVIYSGPSATIAWIERPSLQTCRTATYRASTAGKTLQVRAAPVFSFEVLNAPNSIYVTHLSLDSDYGIKEICGRGLRDGKTIGPTTVNLYPWKFAGSHVQAWAAETCKSPSDATLVLVCRLADKASPGRRLERAVIYGPEMSMAVLHGGNYAVEKRLHQQLTEAHEPFVQVCEGNETSTVETVLFCAAQETEADGLRIKFLFRTNGARLTSDSDAIRAYLRDLVASLNPAQAGRPPSG